MSSRIVGIFPIGDVGEEFGVAEWHPDPEVIEQEFLKLANDTEDWTEPLEEAKAAFIYSTELHFETQSDPYGKPWQVLANSTLKAKERLGYPETILERTGNLREAAINEDAWHISERQIMFDINMLPPAESNGQNYGAAHQAGSGGWHATRKWVSGADLSASEMERFSKGGPGSNLPQRMFIGADEDTIAEIEAIFLAWLEATVEGDLSEFGMGIGSTSEGIFPVRKRLPSGQPLLQTPAGVRFGRTSRGG